MGATLARGHHRRRRVQHLRHPLFEATRFAPEHHWMTLTGGAIGFGLPVALGAAVASKGRVLALESDGSMMYTLQALWSMAREGLDVTVVGLANRSYAVLEWELRRVGATSDRRGERATALPRGPDHRSGRRWPRPRASRAFARRPRDELVARWSAPTRRPVPPSSRRCYPAVAPRSNSPITGAWSDGFSPFRSSRST